MLSVYAYSYGFYRTMPYDIGRRRRHAACEWALSEEHRLTQTSSS